MKRLFALLLALACLLPFWARAAVLEVNTTADELDTPSGPGLSLREALRDATDGTNLIRFASTLNGATITLDAALGEISVTNNVFVDASSLPDGVTVEGGSGSNRLFYVAPHLGVSLFGLTLTGGHGAGAVGSGSGGAIFVDATSKLTLTRCLLTNNSASSLGGAIFGTAQYPVMAGPLILERCTLAGNATTGIGVSGTKFTIAGGGAISSAGPLTLSHCTLTGNHAVGGGGAIFASGDTVLTHCTVSSNSCLPIKSFFSGGGGICSSSAGSSLTLAHSIVAGNSLSQTSQQVGADIHDFPFGSAFNLIGTNIVQSMDSGSPGGIDPHIVTNAPLLAPLGNYGGMVPTMALLPGSPARNAAVGSTNATDQRGFPIVDAPDIGAYEAGTPDSFDAYVWETLPVTATPEQHAGTSDFDGDGASNVDEFAAGTDPASAASVLRVLGLVNSGEQLVVTFTSVAGRRYTIAKADTLAGPWSGSDAAPIIGSGSAMSVAVTPPSGGVSARFYRVTVER